MIMIVIIKDKKEKKKVDLKECFNFFALPSSVIVLVCTYSNKSSILSLALSCKKFGNIITKNKALINRHIIARQRKISPRIFDKNHLIQLARSAKNEDKTIYYEQIQCIFHSDFGLSYETNARVYRELIVEGLNPHLVETEYRRLILLMAIDNVFFCAIDRNYDFSTLAQHLFISLVLTCESQHRSSLICTSFKFFSPFVESLLLFDPSTCTNEEFLLKLDTEVNNFKNLLLKYKVPKKKSCMIV